MKRHKRNKTRKVIIPAKQNEKFTLFTLSRNVAIGLKYFEDAGKGFIQFELPGSVRVSKGEL